MVTLTFACRSRSHLEVMVILFVQQLKTQNNKKMSLLCSVTSSDIDGVSGAHSRSTVYVPPLLLPNF